MSSLTDYLSAKNKYAFIGKIQEQREASDAHMIGFVSSLLRDLVDLVGEQNALQLSKTKDLIKEKNDKAWEIVEKLEQKGVGHEP